MSVKNVINERQKFKQQKVRSTLSHDFGKYEIRLLFITQLGYVPVAASMLLTTFSEPSEKFCQSFNVSSTSSSFSNHFKWDHNEFFSLNMQFGHACSSSSTQVTTFLSSVLMWGALFGSFLCGFLSDFFGRKPVFSGCLTIVSFMNLLLCFSNSLAWYNVIVILLILGFASGGYMVTNFVILTESLEVARSRLLAVSLNGWSFSMIMTAVIAWTTKHWFQFHLVLCVTGVFLTVTAICLTVESCRWLSSVGKYEKAKENSLLIAKINGNNMEKNELDETEWFEILGFPQPVHIIQGKKLSSLYKNPRLLRTTIVMFYCFLASSIVSFGFYFSLDVLPGNRYLNLAYMGFFKFSLGFTPFILSKYLTKRAIVITSVGICFFTAFLILPIKLFKIEMLYWVISVCSLIVAAGMDPAWKINHLYSAELFPTSVRSMGRGVCNAGGRLGSVFAPMVILLRMYNDVIPNVIFAFLLIVQLVVVIFCLPTDDDRNANEMDDE